MVGGDGNSALRGPDTADDLPALILRLSLARGIDEIMAEVRAGARLLSGADGVTFVLREGDTCFYADEDAISPLWKGQRFPAHTCISGWAMVHRQPVVIEDIYRDSRIPHDAYRLTFVKSLVMVPVREDDPVAAIGAYWATHHRATAAEVETLRTIANAAAVAMTNVALYHSLERAADEARRRAEEAERRARELAEAKAAVDRAARQRSHFLAACSHDLRQPFQAMRLFHSMLADGVDGNNRQVVERLGQAMTHGEDLLRVLLDVSIIDSGTQAPAIAPLAVGEVFGRVTATFAGQAAAKGLTLIVMPSSARVASDPVLLTRIIGNLVANAITYTPSGRVLVGARRRGDQVVLEVWDQGVGIAPEHLDEVFDDFFQVGNPQRDKAHGLGLGLGIVRRLAATLGHPVTVRSRLGVGSVFRVAVPAAGRGG